MTRFLDRRALLAAAGTAAVGALAAQPARALTVEPASPELAAMLAARCEGPGLHVRVLADLLDRLGVDRSDDVAVARVEAMPCPVCGCSLASPERASAPRP